MSRHPSRRPERCFRPQVECLEARAVPSTTPVHGGALPGPALSRRALHPATVDDTSVVRVKLSAPQQQGQTIRVGAVLTNMGRATALSPVCLVVRGLDPSISLTNMTGTLGPFYPGSPYVARNINLAGHHSARFHLVFSDPANLPLQFTTAVLGTKLVR
jgi:hypothetical protein